MEDEDIDMGQSGTSRQAKFVVQRGRGKKGGIGGGRSGSPAPKGGRRKLFEGPTSWYKVTVSN